MQLLIAFIVLIERARFAARARPAPIPVVARRAGRRGPAAPRAR